MRRWRESDAHSRQRRLSQRRPRRRSVLLAASAPVAALAVGLALAPADRPDDIARLARVAPLTEPSGLALRVEHSPRSHPASIPSVAALREAWSYARGRGGDVSIAVVNTAGRLRGRRAGKRYVSASVVKAMLLAAEIRRLERDRLSLDFRTRSLLRAMITQSDNDAADSIYLRVGDAGLLEVARLAGLRRFAVAGYWANAQITAADMARFFSRLPGLLARPHRDDALGLLAAVVREQRWGVPRAAGEDWAVFFKGGWRATGLGELVHQVALLRRGDRKVVIAVLTDRQPSQLYGIHTVRGVADRLLDIKRDD